MANETIHFPQASTDMWMNYITSGGTWSGFTEVGYDEDVTPQLLRGAIRFTNVQIPNSSSISSADLHLYVGSREGSDTIKIIVYGVDEDNTSGWGSHPFSKTKTTASNTHEGNPGSSSYFSIGVGSIIEEIVARGGWSSGNAMGFIIEDNGTTQTNGNNNISDVYSASTSDGYLHYRVSASPNFKPTPLSVSAPSIPSAENYGIKISKPGQSVLTATESELYFTTRKKQLKVFDEGKEIANSTPSNIVIAHGLGYIPFVQVYQKDDLGGSGNWVKLPKQNFMSADYALFTIDATNLTIVPPYASAEFYYYIFLEEIT